MSSTGTVCLQLAVLATAIKLLLVPTYRSTDFEVHRNWLAITHSLPLSQWYVEATSEWTLDYPPLFAWFEWAMSQLAKFVDRNMLVVSNLDYASVGTVYFQRASVMASDAVLLAAVYALARGCDAARPPSGSSGSGPLTRGSVLFLLVACSAGLLLVDHIHFQYNGVMMGLLLWSLHAAQQRAFVASGLLFALLLNMKHLFLYAAPAYFVFLLRSYCMEPYGARQPQSAAAGAVQDGSKAPNGGKGAAGATAAAAAGGRGGAGAQAAAAAGRSGGGVPWGRALGRLVLLGGVVVAVFAVSLGPFLALGQGKQLLSRLFPFGRGLCHSYWAANAWALYSGADKVLTVALPKLGVQGIEKLEANMAGGRVGVSRFAVLPQVSPGATALCVLLSILPCLAALWRNSSSNSSTTSSNGATSGGATGGGPGGGEGPGRQLVRAAAYCYLCGFVWGYHVHEKAVLVALLPLALEAVRCRVAARHFLLLSAAGHFGLLPLLFRDEEYGAKVLIVLSYVVLSHAALGSLFGGGGGGKGGKKAGGGGKGGAGGAAGGGGQGAAASGQLVGVLGMSYLYGFLLLELYCSFVHVRVPVLRDKLPFVPLMLTSLYCAVGVVGVWAEMAGWYLMEAAGRQRQGGA